MKKIIAEGKFKDLPTRTVLLLCLLNLPRYLFVKIVEWELNKHNGIIYYTGKHVNKAIVLVNRGNGNREVTVTVPKR